ncbi:signal peptide peptidase SppA [Candidatus Kryptonium thompsonii]|uniref:Signal peptide peptidase SppA n=2 Tax=Candidatus Kryptonium thompsonii TaxID=1633631 RepID=A0A0P1LLN3_9BACT|nr:signal peptide peptidase SppA [Candidatus Kryptonium thompsoni]CUS79983.1 signal peptide peptidase SppA [Candidatus Kryptonium thompsoni]CUS82577.1 signal peptide peptidase SppA [Candidatus Kryptonium thompsoni]CUS84533.1 signal peptide peptidase SppA [Candidatus Kryptonium thompsoni]CUS87861.1 signal peptide peptidase SppA [Candidatus Kryptonium thompsoni]CUT02919.1 signal peptide peptidase SppA [Candidatus Kryptonium thompsoni]
MKLKLLTLLILWTTLSTAQNLYIPSFERYLFTATSDGSEGLRVNPANMGFRHKINFAVYLSSLRKFSVKNYETGLFLQTMNLGIGMKSVRLGDSTSLLISSSTGFGGEGFSFGVGLDYFKIGGEKFKTSINAGVISRPFNFISISFVAHNLTGRYFQNTPLEKRYTAGIGIRPFGNDILTLSSDLILKEKQKPKNFKFGAELKIVNGLNLYAMLDNTKTFSDKKTFIFGFSINLQNVGFKIFTDFENSNIKATASTFFTREVMNTFIYPVKKIAEVEIRGVIPDYKEQPSIFSKPRKSVHDLIDEIEKASTDKDINGLLLKIYPFTGEIKLYELEGLTQELAEAVKKVKKAGKPVVAYLGGEMAGVNELYLASVADKIVIAPECMIVGYGAVIDVSRLKSFFEKFGIEWDAMTAGEYKSTFHSFYTDSATPNQAKLIEGLVDEIHKQMIEQISKSRNINFTDETIEEISGGLIPPRAKELGIVDEIGFYNEAKKMINKLANNRDDENINLTKLDKRKYWDKTWGIIPKIAVIGVHGAIVTGESQPPLPFPLLNERLTGSETVVKQINSAVKDKSIKAIILRVNSGGGSALASNEIYSALKEARKKKPVVVSFGNVAASGGYYVACSSDRIFANPGTLTGSIGVVYSKPVLEKLYENMKIKIETYKKGDHADMFSTTRHWNEIERKGIENALQYTYLGFKQKVAENRNMTLDDVEKLAQGKVYTGTQALDLKLVDELGGLKSAVDFAREKARIKAKYDVKFYPVPSLFGTQDGFIKSMLRNLFLNKLFE